MNKYILPITTLLIGGGAGFYAGYKFGSKKASEAARQEVAEIRQTYAELRAKNREVVPTDDELEFMAEEPAPTVERLDPPLGTIVTEEVLEYADKVEKLGYTHYSNAKKDEYHPPKPDNLRVTPFDNGGSQKMSEAAGHDVLEDPEGEGEPNQELPYIIDTQQFMEESLVKWGEHEQYHDKVTLTYFHRDDTLVDDQEVPVPDPDSIIGTDALSNFGKKSGDTNVVYVRNCQINTDFEIILDRRSYTSAVLGFESEEEEKPRVRKFRESD